jgi:hypothetical protein
MFFTLAEQHPGGMLDMMDSLFSFLARKTDFYTGGPKTGPSAQDMLLEKFRKYEKIAVEKARKEAAEREEADRIRREKLRKQREQEEKSTSKIVEIDDAEAARITAENERKKKSAEVVSKPVETEQVNVENKVSFMYFLDF